MLEVSAGFHHELTGRENVFLSGAILGMSQREIAGRFAAPASGPDRAAGARATIEQLTGLVLLAARLDRREHAHERERHAQLACLAQRFRM